MLVYDITIWDLRGDIIHTFKNISDYRISDGVIFIVFDPENTDIYTISNTSKISIHSHEMEL